MQWRHGTRRWILNFAKSHISFWTLSESPLLPSPNWTITQPHLRSVFACSMMERDKVCSHDGNKGKMEWRETDLGPMWLLMWPLLLEKLSNGQSSGQGGNSQVRVAPHSSEAQELKEGSLGTWSWKHPLTCSWLHRETLWGGSTLPSSSKKVWSEKLCLPGSLNIHSQFCFQNSSNGKPRQSVGSPPALQQVVMLPSALSYFSVLRASLLLLPFIPPGTAAPHSYLSIWLQWVLVVAHGNFHCSAWISSCGLWAQSF